MRSYVVCFHRRTCPSNSMIKLLVENVMTAEIVRHSNGGSCLRAIRNLLGDSLLVAATSSTGGGNTGGVQSLIFYGENSSSSLN
jgi:hypothetical protein